jgi:hypothetical protein
MIEFRCGRCDQRVIPGQDPPLCLGGKYHCDPRTVRRVEVPDQPCRCATPTRRIQIVPLPQTSRRDSQGTSGGTAHGQLTEPSVSPPGDPRVEELRAWARELGGMPGRDAVKKRFGVGSGTANKLREAAATPAIRAVK